MLKTGDNNSELEKAWEAMPENSGDKNILSKIVDANIFLPNDRDYYRFNGYTIMEDLSVSLCLVKYN